MFDIGWSELLVIGVVLVVVVGPKDLPGMLRTFGKTTKQLRSMAGDFRRQFDEALREAELDDVKSTVDEMRKLDPTKDIRKAMNPMKAIGEEIRSSLKAGSEAPAPTVKPADEGATPAAGPLKSAATPADRGAETSSGATSTPEPARMPTSKGAEGWGTYLNAESRKTEPVSHDSPEADAPGGAGPANRKAEDAA